MAVTPEVFPAIPAHLEDRILRLVQLRLHKVLGSRIPGVRLNDVYVTWTNGGVLAVFRGANGAVSPFLVTKVADSVASQLHDINFDSKDYAFTLNYKDASVNIAEEELGKADTAFCGLVALSLASLVLDSAELRYVAGLQ